MARGKNLNLITGELLQQALVPQAEQPFSLPENWVWVKLGNVINVNPPKIKMSDLSDDDKCSFVPMAAVSDTEGVIFAAEEREFKQVKTGYTQFINGDVIFAKITPCMENGKSAIAEGLINGIGYGSTEFYVLRTSGLLMNRLLYQLVRSYTFRAEAKQHMTGAVGQQRVPKKFIEDYPIPLPPLAEQQRIINRIESLFAKLDQAKELAQTALDSFETRKAAILHKAFTGALTAKWREEQGVGLDGWRDISIKDIFNVFSGKGFKEKEYSVEGVKLLRISNVTYNKLTWEDTKCLPEDYVQIEKELVLNPGDIVMALNRPITNNKLKVSLVDTEGPYILYQRVGCLRLKIESNAKYYLYYMLSDEFKRNIELGLQGSDQPYINLPPLKNIRCPVCSISEQQEIVRILDKLTENEDQAKELVDIIEKIDLLKRSILSRAFRGELGTNDSSEKLHSKC